MLHVLRCCPLSLMIVKGLRLLVSLKKTFVNVTFSSGNCEHFSLLFVHNHQLIPNENNCYMYCFYEDLNELIINKLNKQSTTTTID